MRTSRFLVGSLVTLALASVACASAVDEVDDSTASTDSELRRDIFRGTEKTVTVTSDQLGGALLLALAGTRVQVDHRNAGPTLAGEPYYVPPGPIPPYKLEQLGCDEPGRVEECLERLGNRPGTWVTPRYSSYVKWGSLLHALEPSLKDRPFYVPVFEKDTPGPGGVKVEVNNLHVVFGPQTFSAGIGGGKIVADVTLASGQPTLVCSHSFPLLGCPDVRLTNMKLHVDWSGLKTTTDGKSLEYQDAAVQFDTQVDVNNLPDSFLGLFFDIRGALKSAVDSKLRAKLLEADAKKAIGAALLQLVEQRIPAADKPVNKYLSASIQNDALVVRYLTGAIVIDRGPIVIAR